MNQNFLFLKAVHTDLQQALGARPEVLASHGCIKSLPFGLPQPELVLLQNSVYFLQGFRPRALRDETIRLRL